MIPHFILAVIFTVAIAMVTTLLIKKARWQFIVTSLFIPIAILGKVIQAIHTLPRIFRFYLADIASTMAFPATILFLVFVLNLRDTKNNLFPDSCDRKLITQLIIGLSVFSMLQEIFTDHADPYDVLCFFIGGCISYVVAMTLPKNEDFYVTTFKKKIV